VRSLAQHYLVKSDKRQPYQFLFVQVDTDVPGSLANEAPKKPISYPSTESSDQFLLECGFRLDSTVIHATLNAVTPSSKVDRQTLTGEKKTFLIANHVTVASSTEAPFTVRTFVALLAVLLTSFAS